MTHETGEIATAIFAIGAHLGHRWPWLAAGASTLWKVSLTLCLAIETAKNPSSLLIINPINSILINPHQSSSNLSILTDVCSWFFWFKSQGPVRFGSSLQASHPPRPGHEKISCARYTKAPWQQELGREFHRVSPVHRLFGDDLPPVFGVPGVSTP